MAGQGAVAQPAGNQVQEIVVTGTSIRGVAPVGSSVITMDRAQIQETGAQTVAQLLNSIPAVTTFGGTGQGGAFTPTIHSLGASASNGTLVLVDGHRMPYTGVNHNLIDANAVPPNALERVEVLPEGASSTYGSDAVAGVLNFITRRRFDGVELTAQTGFGDGYRTGNLGVAAGKAWEGGYALLVYNYSFRSNIRGDARDYNQADLRSRGGGTFQNFNCSPATFQGGAGNLIYTFPYTAGQGVATTAPGVCDNRRIADLVPMEGRNNALAKFEQKVGDRLTLQADIVYSNQLTKTNQARNVITATVFGPGSTPAGGAGQINPFFRGLPGATSGTYRFDFNEMFGPGARTKSGTIIGFGTFGAEYDLGSEWLATLGATAGQESGYQRGSGAICIPCAYLALNGTTNQAGNPNTNVFPALLGATSTETRLPITAGTALDIWNTGAANRTSAAVRDQLLENADYQHSTHTIQDVRLKLDGPLFSLPGGAVRVAVGGEFTMYGMRQVRVRNGAAGPGSVSATNSDLTFDRNVSAVFGEILIPIVGEGNSFPMVRRLELNLAARHDRYNDVGKTTNPKVAVSWEVTDGLILRGNWGTSFTAPMLSPSRGVIGTGRTGESGYALYTGTATVPLTFPGASNLPGCTASGCQIGPVVQGIQVSGGNPNLVPQEGESWALGFDVAPHFLSGFRASVTYWNAKYQGLITASPLPTILSTPGLYDAFVINPTPAQLAAFTSGIPQTGPLPTTINFIYDFRNRNAFNLDAAGIDFEASQRFASPIGDVTLRANGTLKTKFNQQAGPGAPWISRLNTAGVNTTFNSLKFGGRLGAAVKNGPFGMNLDVSHVGGYLSLAGNPPFTVSTVGATVTGGQKVDSYTTLDLRVSYDFEGDGILANTQVYLDGNNILDADPPFVNVNGGFSQNDSSPFGRVLTFGVRRRW